METPGTSKKKKKADKKQNNELVQIRVEIAKPGSKKYTHIDWEEALKKNGKEKDEEELRRFYDPDTLFMAKKLGGMKSKSGKKLRVNLDELQHLNRNSGYDMEDDFIDDSEAVEEAVFQIKKGKFYVGKGELKNLDEEEEEDSESDVESLESDSEDVENPTPKKSQKTKTSSDSEDVQEPVRMTGAPPTSRMAGAPPTKRALSNKAPPTGSPVSVRTTAPPTLRKDTSDSTASLEPPEKKKKSSEPSTSNPEVTSSEGQSKNLENSEKTPQKSFSTKGSTVTLLAKNIVQQHQEAMVKKSSSTPSLSTSSQPSKPSTSSSSSSSTTTPKTTSTTTSLSKIEEIFSRISEKAKIHKSKNLKTFDSETLSDIKMLIEAMKHHKSDKISFEPLIYNLANSFGMTSAEVMAQLENINTEKNWKLTKTDLPHFTEAELSQMTIIVKSWKSKKAISNVILNSWIKVVCQSKLDVDQARKKFFEYINSLPDVDKQEPAAENSDLPKHERSRKARMFLNQWVYLSRKNVETNILPELATKKVPSTDGLAMKQAMACNTLKEALKKQMHSFENKKEKLPEDAVYTFQFTDPVLAVISAYIDDLLDYSLSTGKLEILVAGIDSIYPPIAEKISLIQFYIELCRRLQKITFLIVEEPVKSRMKEAKELIVKHQVVQNPKYSIKWPDGQEPSLRGLTKELHEFETSILANWKQQYHHQQKTLAPPTSKPPTTTSSSSTSSENSEDPRRLALHQIVQVYLGKYLLSSADNSTAQICDPATCPMNDETLLCMITAVYSGNVTLPNQMIMFKNILSHVGQVRMAQSIALQKAKSIKKLTTKELQLLFDYFQKYERFLEKSAKKLEAEKEKEEERRKKAEEKERKEKEKQDEKIRKEKEKREEKERKEAEKRREEIRRMEEEARRIKECEEAERRKLEEKKEMEEREERKRRDTEAANALQGLEEDLLMDDADFQTEQQSKHDSQQKLAEEQRAVERENQMKLMRAQQFSKAPPPPQEAEPEGPFPPQEAPPTFSFGNSIKMERTPSDTKIDILSAAEEAADLPKAPPPKPQSALEKLAALRGRTLSADFRRNSEIQLTSGIQNPQNPKIQNSEFPIQMTSEIQNSVKSEFSLQHSQMTSGIQNFQNPTDQMTSGLQSAQIQNPQNPQMTSGFQNYQNTQNQQSQMTSSPQIQNPQNSQNQMTSNFQNTQNPPFQMTSTIPNSQFLQNQMTSSFGSFPNQMTSGIQNPQIQMTSNFSNHQNQISQFHRQNSNFTQSSSRLQNPNPPTSSPYGSPMDQRKSMSHPHHPSPLQYPTNYSIQSPMSNSSLIHTPMSNGSMIPQSPQFSSHPSPMSQQYHTPPSMHNSPHHFSYPTSTHSTINFSPQRPQQMHRQPPPQPSQNQYPPRLNYPQ